MRPHLGVALVVLATACSPGVRHIEPNLLAYATSDEVRVVDRLGHLRRVADHKGVVDLEFSADGRYVASLSYDPLMLGMHDLVTGRSQWWTPPSDGFYADDLARNGDRIVVVANNMLLRFDPAAADEPEQVPLRGVTGPAHLLAADDERVLVAVSEPDYASAHGGPETVYQVAPDGGMTLLFNDGDGLPEGEVRNMPIGAAALTADGTKLLYETGAGGLGPDFDCDLGFGVVLRDLVANREIPLDPLPRVTKLAVPDEDILVAYDDITTGRGGRTIVDVATDVGGCGGDPHDAAFELQGTHWVPQGENVRWTDTSRDGRTAVLDRDDTLRTHGHTATGVTVAAWSPR